MGNNKGRDFVKRITTDDINQERNQVESLLNEYVVLCNSESSSKEDCINASKKIIRGFLQLDDLHTTFNNQILAEVNDFKDTLNGVEIRLH